MEVPIQVAVQICPCYPNEVSCVETIPNYADGDCGQLNVIENINTGLVRVTKPRACEDVNGNPEDDEKTAFAIQHALPYGCSQDFLYQKTVQPMILNFLEGFDISIVTYGQYCTGKTYSMYGPNFDCGYKESEQGIVVRAISDMFAHLMKRPAGCRFAINVAWIDVRGDEIHDLLGGDGIIQCQTIEDVFQCLRIGLVNRHPEGSHNLFTITIEQQWVTPTGLIQHRLSTASFCDLSGTERMLVVNEFNEQISVPKDISLQALERIVLSLCVPTISMLDNEKINLMNQYEDTMLTKLLKDSIGGRAQSLMIFCVSPLQQDALETIHNLQFAYKAQFVRNKVVMNTFSDNNMPIPNYNFIDPIEQDLNIPKAIHFNPPVEKSNRKNGQNSMGLKFANTQWLKLVSNAEGLFNKLLVNNKTLNEQDRECIEEWMFLKQECEDCLSSAGFTVPRPLGPIQETNESGENSSEEGDVNAEMDQNKLAISMQRAMESDRFTGLNETDNDSDSDQTEYLTERIADLMISFSCKMNETVDKSYADFVKTYPRGVMQSIDDKQNELACVKTKRSNSVVMPAGEAAAYPVNSRRRSVQTGDSNTGIPSNAELVRLNRIADECIQNSQSSTNTVCREMNEFLENSDDLHPLRVANVNKVKDAQNDICRVRSDIKAKEKQTSELRENITNTQQLIHELMNSTGSRAKAKQRLNRKESQLKSDKEKCKKMLTSSRETKEIAQLQINLIQIEKDLNEVFKMKEASRDSDDTIKEYQQQLQKRRKQLNALTKELKKEKKMLETLEAKQTKNAKEEKKSMAMANVDTHITQLDCVLKEKRMYLHQNSKESEYEESIRHEIRNLRSQRERLTDAQCVLNQKLKCDRLTEREARQILEFDVTKEVIDHAIECKNELICGREVSKRGVSNPDLMSQLNKLKEREMRILLYKCFQKIVDLRESSRHLEIQLLHLEKECNDWKLRERSLSQKFQQFRLEKEGYTLHLQKQYQTLLTKIMQKSCENGGVNLPSMPNEAPMLMSSPHIIRSKHRHQHSLSNEIGFNIHGYNRSRQQERHLYRIENSAFIAPSDHDTTEPYDSFQKQKQKEQKNSLFKFLRHSSSNALKRGIQNPPLMLTNPSQTNNNAEGKVTVDNKHKKIFIQQNKS